MERKVLAAVDGSHHSLDAVRYLGSTFGQVEDFKIVLMHMMAAPPPGLVQDARTSGDALAKLKMFQSKLKRQAESVVERCWEELVRSGVPADRIERRLASARGGVAKSIVFEAQNGLFDALVVGRRGLGRFQELFIGSVSQKIVHEAQSIPVWVVDGAALGKNILVALDGSDDSFRAVDHVGFIASRHPELKITLCHVSTSLARDCPLEMDEELRRLDEELLHREENRCLETFFTEAIKMLTEQGVPRDSIDVHFKSKRLEIARAILEDARENDCRTVVIGRRGVSKAKDVFLGSITTRVIQGAQDLAVWVIV